jgi:hypothetical protein
MSCHFHLTNPQTLESFLEKITSIGLEVRHRDY